MLRLFFSGEIGLSRFDRRPFGVDVGFAVSSFVVLLLFSLAYGAQ